MQNIIEAAFHAGLSPLASRIAVVVGSIAGAERALGFIRSCKLKDEFRAVVQVPVGTVHPDSIRRLGRASDSGE